MARGLTALRAALGAVGGVTDALQQRELLAEKRRRDEEAAAIQQAQLYASLGMRAQPYRPASEEQVGVAPASSMDRAAFTSALQRGMGVEPQARDGATTAFQRSVQRGMGVEPTKADAALSPLQSAFQKATSGDLASSYTKRTAETPGMRQKLPGGMEVAWQGQETDEEKLNKALAALPESERERLEPVVRASFAGVPANVAQVMFAPREEKQALQPWAKEGFATEKEYLAYKKREKEATALPKDGTEGGPKFGEVASLRKEFNTESRPYKTVNDALKIIESLGTKANPTPQDIQALTYAFVKVQDPTSVVRETEYANAERAIALADKVGSLGTRIVQGQRLSPTQRKDMVNTARALRAEAMARYGALANSYEELAGSFGMNPKTIVPNRLDRDVNPAKDGKERLPGETAAQFLARTGGKR
jgi:hypothetical protein